MKINNISKLKGTNAERKVVKGEGWGVANNNLT